MNASSAVLLTTLALVAAVVGPSPARAEPLRDEATGLAVEPPEGYEAKKAEGDARYAAVYAVQKKGEVDTGCKVAFQPVQSNLPAEEKLNQDEINSLTRQQKWMDLVRATLAIRYDVKSVERIEQQGLAGAAVVGDFAGGEGEPKDSGVRSYLVVFDTPKGRTTIVCVGEKKDFDGRRKDFEAIARGVSPPK